MRRVIVPITAIGILLGVVGIASPASATGTHCAKWGVVRIWGHSLPTGQYCFSVVGSGTRVSFTSGSYNTGWIYNAGERVRFYDTRGTNYATWYTHQDYGTTYGYHYWTTGIRGNARYGRACGEMLSSGAVIASACVDLR